MSAAIDTDKMSVRWRAKALRPETRQVLVTNFTGTKQAIDFTVPPNCGGFGRIHHFRRDAGTDWPPNPLPVEPAARRLGVPAASVINAQVFQNAACNWRCWYCFVPFELLRADEKLASWLTADQLVDYYLAENERAPMIDLSGGQPELTPEWVPWMMEALTKRGLETKVFLWSDDNLSNDYFWQFLSEAEIERVRAYTLYARVCCFKGFDGESFAFNTKAEPALFDRQFELFARYHELGLDLYCYTTFTAPNTRDIPDKMARFVDRLQMIHPNLPLRTVPLKIVPYSVVASRNFPQQAVALAAQQVAIGAWTNEMERRFPAELRARSIVDISLK